MQSSALEPLGLGRAHFFLVSRLTFLIIYFGLPCVRTRSWKMLVIKPRGEGEQRLECSPVAPCRQPLQSRPACLYLKRKRGRLSPPLPLLMIFFFFFFSPLVTEEACYRSEQTSDRGTLQSPIPAEGRICCGLSLVRSLVWSWFCSFVLSRTEEGLITVDIFEGSLQFDRNTAIQLLEQTEFI